MGTKENILTTDLSPHPSLIISLLNTAVIILSFYLLGALLIETFWDFPNETAKLFHYFDNIICLFSR